MKGKLLGVLLITAIVAGGASQAHAISLWSDRSSLFTDQKASQIGDLVLVDINEVLNDKDEGKLTSTKTSDNNIGNGFGILDFIRSLGLTSANSMSGNTKVERKKDLKGTISCIVIDVLPNGNMVIEGGNSLISGAEKMMVKYKGVVRPMDISHGNRVSSERVANAEIAVSGRGVITRTQRPGLINQVLTAIF